MIIAVCGGLPTAVSYAFASKFGMDDVILHGNLSARCCGESICVDRCGRMWATVKTYFWSTYLPSLLVHASPRDGSQQLTWYCMYSRRALSAVSMMATHCAVMSTSGYSLYPRHPQKETVACNYLDVLLGLPKILSKTRKINLPHFAVQRIRGAATDRRINYKQDLHLEGDIAS